MLSNLTGVLFTNRVSPFPKLYEWKGSWMDSLRLFPIIWQYIACALQQVVSEEETPERVLDTPAHLHQVL